MMISCNFSEAFSCVDMYRICLLADFSKAEFPCEKQSKALMASLKQSNNWLKSHGKLDYKIFLKGNLVIIL